MDLICSLDWLPGETWKAKDRRAREGWFEKYAPSDKSGIDIGCQDDPINDTFRKWDLIFGDGDATFMEGVPDDEYHTVYCSNILEHLTDVLTAVRNWYRITKPGGHMIILVPHRDLYEKKTTLPSSWNPEHKWFFMPEHSEPPHTIGLKHLMHLAIPNVNIVSLKVLKDGYLNLPINVHPMGEYSIELIVAKG
jgi:SAM-dependent methyltransferase